MIYVLADFLYMQIAQPLVYFNYLIRFMINYIIRIGLSHNSAMFSIFYNILITNILKR
jgi:hypothetical protein